MAGGDRCKPRTLSSRGRVEARDTSIAVPKIVAGGFEGSDNRGRSLIPVFLMLMSIGVAVGIMNWICILKVEPIGP